MNRQPIDDLIDKPLNELTEEEARIVIEWQAAKAFEEYKFSEEVKLEQEKAEAIANAYKEQADAAKEVLQELKARALAFYEQQ